MKEVDQHRHTKNFTDNLLSWVSGRGKIAIIVHDNPDPDCLASALALRHLFVMKLNRDAVITFSGMIGRSENLAMAKELEIPLTPLGLVDMHDFHTICMLDTQPGTGNNSLPLETRVDVIIDHHPIREATRKCRWVDIREGYGATSTILYEYLQIQHVSIGTKLATALFYAIKSETQDLGREANQPDRDAYLHLFPYSNKKLLYAISYPKLPIDYFTTINIALENAKIFNKVLVTNLLKVIFPELVAEMADFLLRLEGIETVLSIGHYNDGVVLSMRTICHDINAGEIIIRLVAGKGSAGGHGMMAGGRVDNVPAVLGDILEVEEFLIERILSELAIGNVKPSKLIQPRC